MCNLLGMFLCLQYYSPSHLPPWLGSNPQLHSHSPMNPTTVCTDCLHMNLHFSVNMLSPDASYSSIYFRGKMCIFILSWVNGVLDYGETH
ncbi:hypothetical protein SKAU_G00239460 [Synaphobranchus kaupii]|uniref:Uncharacterized protein n=1 Tax=Synaphobranchus kaupii TaxID=118154 RepID=A0A9Q1F7F9_SYNKA|nr:hypothetical protein SKAU_G00239460 [Synaphobranchus kaupii]